MDEQQDRNTSPHDDGSGQQPHTPGQDPRGSGEPRQPEDDAVEPDATDPDLVVADRSLAEQEGATGAGHVRDEDSASDEPRTDPEAPQEQTAPRQDAPLGGDESTQERLQADTEVEEDAIRGLDPDDSPA
ncbi:hypothetical protein [Microbacterium resistens]|uniref:hypothetical protein n=1 Tax=Microbacterium resistens TaxID=156977 RepID=UPI000833A3F3|nr:hypothetical protein [Microbacterium resistens]